jgi:hypothetical protein
MGRIEIGKNSGFTFDEDGNLMLVVPSEKYHALVEKAKEWDRWCEGEGVSWEKDNYGQVLIYTGKDWEGNEIDFEEDE